MRPNRYAAKCAVCKETVIPGDGSIRKIGKVWRVEHYPNCSAQAQAQAQEQAVEVHTFTFSSGMTVTQNVNGRCEDAPCCGCCS